MNLASAHSLLRTVWLFCGLQLQNASRIIQCCSLMSIVTWQPHLYYCNYCRVSGARAVLVLVLELVLLVALSVALLLRLEGLMAVELRLQLQGVLQALWAPAAAAAPQGSRHPAAAAVVLVWRLELLLETAVALEARKAAAAAVLW